MFTGFTDATVDFLWGIRFNNERPWFEAHKETYLSELYRPMKDLGAEIYDFLSEQRPEDPMVCRVSRIYRDARRLHGRGPYKDHLWFCVERPAEDWTTRPTFWFELGPDYWGYGMGCWMARPMDMAKLRSRTIGYAPPDGLGKGLNIPPRQLMRDKLQYSIEGICCQLDIPLRYVPLAVVVARVRAYCAMGSS